jgi:hypothetical protein
MKFTKKQVDLMEALGHMTDMQKLMCHEGFQEAYWEQRANGIPAKNDFTEWLERTVIWRQQRDRLKGYRQFG